MLEKLFKLKENKTNITTELIAGITTFMAMSYIIFINPLVLSETGMDYNSVYVATILASMIGTFFLGLFANVPYVQSAGLGLNALFTYTICGSMGFSWQQGLAMVFICGVINVLITLTSVRKKVIKAIHNAGGIAILAHPCCCNVFSLDDFVRRLKEFGLDGIEVYYPYDRFRGILKFSSRKLPHKLAQKYELIKTGGSDEHKTLAN